MIFAWVVERRDEYPVTLLCHALGVSRSGFYAWRSRKPGATAVRRGELAAEVEAIHAEVKARYGSPRMHAELVGRGHECGIDTVAKLMRRAGIAAGAKRKFRQTTDSTHALPVAENLLGRQFEPTEPNAVWVADIPSVPTREGWLDLAVVVDLFSRLVDGHDDDESSGGGRARAWWRTRTGGASSRASTTAGLCRARGRRAA